MITKPSLYKRSQIRLRQIRNYWIFVWRTIRFGEAVIQHNPPITWWTSDGEKWIKHQRTHKENSICQPLEISWWAEERPENQDEEKTLEGKELAFLAADFNGKTICIKMQLAQHPLAKPWCGWPDKKNWMYCDDN